jgi:phosphoglycerate dehydrogenase-like enzyme
MREERRGEEETRVFEDVQTLLMRARVCVCVCPREREKERGEGEIMEF